MGLLKTSSIYLFGRALPALVAVGGVALYTRLLDPKSVGAYALLLSTSLLASGIGYAWLRVAALRITAGSGDLDGPDLLATVAILFLVASAIITICEAVALRIYNPGLPLTSLALAVIAAIASAWYELNVTILQARLKVVSWGILNLARAVCALGFSVALIFAGLKTDALLGGFVLGNCATFAVIRLWLPSLRGSFNPKLCRRLFSFGWPTSVTAAQALFGPTVLRFIIDATAGSGAVGLFAVAFDFSSQAMSVLIGSISLAGIPLAFKAKDSGDPDALARQLRDNARLIFAVGLPAAVGLVVLAGPLTHVVFGPRFRTGADIILAILAVATFSSCLRGYYFDQAFELAMQTRPQATISGIGAVVSIGAGLLLIPRFGAVGAALSTLSGSLLCLACSVIWGARITDLPVPVRSWLKTALATAGMLIALELVPEAGGALGLAAGIALGALIYFLLSTVTRLRLVRAQFSRFVWLQR